MREIVESVQNSRLNPLAVRGGHISSTMPNSFSASSPTSIHSQLGTKISRAEILVSLNYSDCITG